MIDRLPAPSEPVLRDPILDGNLERDGFVVIDEPVVDEATATWLRAEFGRLHDWRGDGFLNDFNHRNLVYRERSRVLLTEHLGPVVDRLFTDHEPFLSTYLCKWPDTRSYFVPHRDWMYVDERAGDHSYLAFVALEPIDEHNGRVQMLPGSHRVDPMPRGSNLYAPWVDHPQVEARLEPISLAVGQCIIWSSAIVHASFPNATAEPRVAAGLWTARRGAPLVHYRRLGTGLAGRYTVDATFFQTQNAYRLMVSRPPFPLDQLVAFDEVAVPPGEVGAILDAARRPVGTT